MRHSLLLVTVIIFFVSPSTSVDIPIGPTPWRASLSNVQNLIISTRSYNGFQFAGQFCLQNEYSDDASTFDHNSLCITIYNSGTFTTRADVTFMDITTKSFAGAFMGEYSYTLPSWLNVRAEFNVTIKRGTPWMIGIHQDSEITFSYPFRFESSWNTTLWALTPSSQPTPSEKDVIVTGITCLSCKINFAPSNRYSLPLTLFTIYQGITVEGIKGGQFLFGGPVFNRNVAVGVNVMPTYFTIFTLNANGEKRESTQYPMKARSFTLRVEYNNNYSLFVDGSEFFWGFGLPPSIITNLWLIANDPRYTSNVANNVFDGIQFLDS